MWRRALVGSLFAMLAMTVLAPEAGAAACAVACRDEVSACVTAECQGLVKRARRRCRRQCKRSIVRDCFADLSVCGATVARPPGAGGGGGSTGGW
jgi:hypothetical protein